MIGVILVSGCNDDSTPGHDSLVAQVEGSQVGHAPDHWIEIRNLSGEWERVGLIFGYLSDSEVCEGVIRDLKVENYAREYRCVYAN